MPAPILENGQRSGLRFRKPRWWIMRAARGGARRAGHDDEGSSDCARDLDVLRLRRISRTVHDDHDAGAHSNPAQLRLTPRARVCIRLLVKAARVAPPALPLFRTAIIFSATGARAS